MDKTFNPEILGLLVGPQPKEDWNHVRLFSGIFFGIYCAEKQQSLRGGKISRAV